MKHINISTIAPKFIKLFHQLTKLVTLSYICMGIVPRKIVSNWYNSRHPLARLSIHCSKIVNTNYPIKIKHFRLIIHMFIVGVCLTVVYSITILFCFPYRQYCQIFLWRSDNKSKCF
jgi:hypothetical protein